MATHWLREITTATTGTATGFPFASKCLALFLQNVLGYTNAVESVFSGSYFSTEKSGVNGSINITATDKTFRDTTAASFVVGDTGKWLLLVDNTNPRNSGFYKVTHVDANNVTLDFRSGAAEYPTQNLGANLSWWLLADNYQVPITDQDYFRLRTPHAAGWEIEVLYVDPGVDQGYEVRLSVDANWAGSNFGQGLTTSKDFSLSPLHRVSLVGRVGQHPRHGGVAPA